MSIHTAEAMSVNPQEPEGPGEAAEAAEPEKRPLPPAAQRALAEAEERRRLAAQQAAAQPKELGGRNGPDPVRYGDWEKGGIVSDF